MNINKKLLIGIGACGIIYMGIFMLVFWNKLFDNSYLDIVLDNTSFRYKNGEFKKLDSEDIDNKKYDVYIDNVYYGNYVLRKIAKWNLFDDNDNFIKHDGNFLGIGGSKEYEIINFNGREINEEEKAYLRDEYKINSFKNLAINNVIDVDLNNDGRIDKIINISNYSIEVDQKDCYYLVVAIINGKDYVLINSSGTGVNSFYYVTNIIKTNEKYNYIIINEVIKPYSDIENNKQSNMLFVYEHRDYINIG